MLPNQSYPTGWLTISAGGVTYPIGGNPCKPIYGERYRWWRLANPEWPRLGEVFDLPIERGAVSGTLGDYYHPVTYAFYGADSDRKAWGKIRWEIGTLRFAMRGPASVFNTDEELKNLIMNGVPTSDDGGGTVEARVAHSSWMGDFRDRFSIKNADSPGGGTVPHESGLAPRTRGSAIEQFSFEGFDHQSAYLPEMGNVMAVTKYAIAKIAQKADWRDT